MAHAYHLRGVWVHTSSCDVQQVSMGCNSFYIFKPCVPSQIEYTHWWQLQAHILMAATYTYWWQLQYTHCGQLHTYTYGHKHWCMHSLHTYNEDISKQTWWQLHTHKHWCTHWCELDSHKHWCELDSHKHWCELDSHKHWCELDTHNTLMGVRFTQVLTHTPMA